MRWRYFVDVNVGTFARVMVDVDIIELTALKINTQRKCSLEGVDIGVLVEERAGNIKGSFRAKDSKFRVDLLAKKFDGGGHACAAGFNLSGTLDQLYDRLVEEIGKHLQAVEQGDVL